jgi:hypothetical protein
MAIPDPLSKRFNKKEQRLFDYLADKNNSRRIGDICKALRTTAWTLSKTQEKIERKCEEFNTEYLHWCAELGIEP